MRRILIIKTGYCETFRPDLTYSSISFGDILRTTPILHLFKNDEVHWLTDIKAVPLLFGLKEISCIHLVNTLDVLGLETYKWDYIINLENSRGACKLLENLIKPGVKFDGYYFDSEQNKILIDLPPSGDNWSEKLFSILGEKWNGEISLIPHKEVKTEDKLVFLNKSVGPKLPEKRWDGWDKLELILNIHGFKTCCQKSLSLDLFIEEIQKATFIISTDSLGLHIAMALYKPVLGLFGPSLASEISGIKNFIQSENLSLLSPEDVFEHFTKIWRENEA